MPKRKRIEHASQHATNPVIVVNRSPSAEDSSYQRHSQFKAASVVPKLEAPTFRESAEDMLCAGCCVMDLNAIFSLKVKRDIGIHIQSLKATVNKLKHSSCSLCKLFASMAPQEDDNARCYLRAYSATRVLTRLNRNAFEQRDVTLLGVVGFKVIETDITDLYSLGETRVTDKIRESLEHTGYLHSRKYHSKLREPLLRVRLISSQKVDVEFVKRCITYCEENHKTCCRPSATSYINSRFFKLINCSNGMVVSPPSRCEYATLSYVWAETHTPKWNDASDTQETQTFLSQYPSMISDSILITSKLGLRYLWVDKYCIDQDDDEAKRDQISQMHSIYANSKFTIVAASNHPGLGGLPGVSSLCRKRQPSLEVLGHHLVSTLPNPKATVRKSVWSRRGWTFQEALLSRRCLIFTEEQVIFECNGMHSPECLDLDWEVMNDPQTRAFKAQIPPGPLERKPVGSDPFDIMSYVLRFRERKLTFQNDKLNALQGVFQAFRETKHPVHQLMGVPIYPPIFQYGDGFPNEDIDRTPEESFTFALTWYHLQPGKRDLNFPSWSWAGWTGGYLSEQYLVSWMREESLGHIRISIELESKRQNGLRPRLQSFPLQDELSTLQSLSSRDPSNCYIHMEVICIPCHTAFLPPRTDTSSRAPRGGQYVSFQIEDDLRLYIHARMDGTLRKDEMSGLGLTAILLHDPRDITKGPSQTDGFDMEIYVRGVMLLVEDHRDYYERVGICSITLSHVKSQSGWYNLSIAKLEAWMRGLPSPTRIRLH